MPIQPKLNTFLLFSSIVFFLPFSDFGKLSAQDVYLCVWRNPERTMTRIFPDAKDYVTVNKSISPEQLQKIEARTGTPLLPGQRDRFQYFRMMGEGGKTIGTIIAASQKGTYGAIEFVVGVDTAGIIKGLYVQRSRERDRIFKKREFLDLFIGKPMDDYTGFAEYYQGEKTAGTEAVIQGLKKEFVAYGIVADQ